jgi:hypothetical protein
MQVGYSYGWNRTRVRVWPKLKSCSGGYCYSVMEISG